MSTRKLIRDPPLRDFHGAVTQAPAAWREPNLQAPEESGRQHEPQCLHGSGTVCPSSSWGLRTKSRGPDSSPGPSLQTGLARESSLRPAVLTCLHVHETALKLQTPANRSVYGDSKWVSEVICQQNHLLRKAPRAQAGSSKRWVGCYVNMKN